MPRLERIETGRHTTGRLLGGDGHLRAFATRAHQVGHQHVYRSPWPLTGATAEAIADWITAGVGNDRDGELEQICRAKHRGAEGLAAEGDEFARTGGLEAGLEAGAAAGLDQRLAHAAKQLAALTPASGRGKRQSTGEATRVKAMQHGLTAQGVEGLRCMEWEPPIARPPPTSAGAEALPRMRENIRDHITHIARQESAIAALTDRLGWKVCVTNAAPPRWSWADAVWCDHDEYRIERKFNRRKSRVHIAPLLVKRDDQIQGLTYLLTLGVGV
jgi:hypothetical protein